MRIYLHENTLDDDTWYGFLSPSFAVKTGVSSRDLYGFLDRVDPHADVALFSHGWDQIAYFRNVFEQGESSHPGLVDASAAFFGEAGIGLDVRTYVGHSQNTVFSNYLAAKPVFWRRWLHFADLLFERAESGSTSLSGALGSVARYPAATYAGLVQMKAFVQERIASALLATDPFKVAVADLSAHLPVYSLLFYEDLRTRRLLHTCDTLKIEHCLNGDAEFLAMYRKVRACIPTKRPVKRV
jgi:hypothetical protein